MLFKYIEEEEAAISKGKKPEYEESVFQKLLKLDRKIALGMTMDIINGGVETVSKSSIIKIKSVHCFIALLFLDGKDNISCVIFLS